MAASSPSTARASVRAMITRPSCRASHAARSLPTISACETTALPAKWPQRLGNTWSSSCTAATPMRSKARTVRVTFTALPNPVSISAITGSDVASTMCQTASRTSVMVVRPTSAQPR
jgi:hypothetical protein